MLEPYSRMNERKADLTMDFFHIVRIAKKASIELNYHNLNNLKTYCIKCIYLENEHRLWVSFHFHQNVLITFCTGPFSIHRAPVGRLSCSIGRYLRNWCKGIVKANLLYLLTIST